MRLLSVEGKVLCEQSGNGWQLQEAMNRVYPNLNSGVYILNLQLAGKQEQVKLVKL